MLKLTIWIAFMYILRSLRSTTVNRLFRAFESVKKINADFYFEVRFCFWTSTCILATLVWSLTAKVRVDSLASCLFLCRPWINEYMSRESPKWLSRRFFMLFILSWRVSRVNKYDCTTAYGFPSYSGIIENISEIW